MSPVDKSINTVLALVILAAFLAVEPAAAQEILMPPTWSVTNVAPFLISASVVIIGVLMVLFRIAAWVIKSINAALALAIFTAFLAVEPAHAQQINGITTWGVTNIAHPLISAAVVIIGVLMVLFRIAAQYIAAWVIGGLVIANYQAIAGLMGGT